MKKIYRFLFMVVLLTGTGSSCKKWLDARPEGDLFVDQVLTDRAGFTKALSGVYGQLGAAALYGRELEFGTMDAMVGYWQINTQHVYFPAYNFNYQNQQLQQTLLGIWSGLYQAVHQCNMILEQIEKIKNDPYYALIKGETLGLRAFLHFEALRLFGPIVRQKGLDTPAVPYYTTPTKTAQPALTSRACLVHIESDLQAAKQLLHADPMISLGREANGNGPDSDYNSLLDRRGIHMNYYAVMALLARKSQWAEDLPQAAARAQELLQEIDASQAVQFIRWEELFSDIRLTKENIWGLYINQYAERIDGYFNGPLFSQTALRPEYDHFLVDFYQRRTGSPQDIRHYWEITNTFFSKFNISPSSEDSTVYTEVQLINLPEIYFILVEANLAQDVNKSLQYLNAVRQHRNLRPLIFEGTPDSQTVLMWLLDEVRREYIGEGFLFTYYKHLNQGIPRITGIAPATDTIFVFPAPGIENSLKLKN